jgi:dihydropyrimidinase
VEAGTFASVSSDHAPYRFDETGKLRAGLDANFKQIANGMPGITMRLPLLFSEGVRKGRISINQFVALSSTNAAKTFGLAPNKGTIAIGADADIAIWDPDETRTVTLTDQHDAMDYTPFEGMTVTGWPATVLSRGRPVVLNGELTAQAGTGRFVARGTVDLSGLPGHRACELDPAQNFGAGIAP